MKYRQLFAGMITGIFALMTTGCWLDQPAEVASRNLSQAADNFQVYRRILFINGITDKYLLTIEGFCSLGSGTSARSITVTCKTGPDTYLKHLLGLSDNTTYVVEQLMDISVPTYHYVVQYRPEVIIPNLKLDISR